MVTGEFAGGVGGHQSAMLSGTASNGAIRASVSSLYSPITRKVSPSRRWAVSTRASRSTSHKNGTPTLAGTAACEADRVGASWAMGSRRPVGHRRTGSSTGGSGTRSRRQPGARSRARRRSSSRRDRRDHGRMEPPMVRVVRWCRTRGLSSCGARLR